MPYRPTLPILAVAVCAAGASAQYTPVYGGPAASAGYSSLGYQYLDTDFARALYAGQGVATGFATLVYEITYNGRSTTASARVPIRWDAAGASGELAGYGAAFGGNFGGAAVAINGSNQIVGSVYRSTAPAGTVASRWGPGSPAPTALQTTGAGPADAPYAVPTAINENGTAVGYSNKYVNGVDQGYRGVRWGPGGTAATELPNPANGRYGRAVAVSDTDYAAGSFVRADDPTGLDRFPVRWGPAATPEALGRLPGATNAEAVDVNNAGTVIGRSNQFTGAAYNGVRPVRWDVGSGQAVELGTLGVDQYGYPSADATDINNAGTIIGRSSKFTASHPYGTVRAVRWDAGSAGAVELPTLSLTPDGGGYAEANAINDHGLAVGLSQIYRGTAFVGNHAALWLPDGRAVDLNSLIAPDSGWTLTAAYTVSETDWVAGMGTFDPDGTGPLAATQRPFLLQVPEPNAAAAAAVLTAGLLRRRRRRPAAGADRAGVTSHRVCGRIPAPAVQSAACAASPA